MLGLDVGSETRAVLPGVADAARLAVLERTGLASGTQDEALDHITRLAAALLHTPSAYVTLVGLGEWFAPGAFDLDRPGDAVRRMPASGSLCQFQVVTEEPLIVPDTRTDPLTQNKAGVLDGSIVAYAGVPLQTRSGHVLGSLCVNDRQPREWTPEELELLQDLGAVVTRDLEQRLAARRSEELQASARELSKETPALLDAVSGLVELAEQQDEARLQRYAALARSRSQRVQELASRLTSSTAATTADEPAQEQVVELGRAVDSAFATARAATGTSALQLDALPDGPLFVRCNPLALERALVHLLVSALHHTGDGEVLAGRIAVSRSDEAGTAQLTLSALGTQLPAAELGRIVARFTQASCSSASASPGSASFRVVGGEVRTSSGPVSGRSSRHGFAFEVSWELQSEQGRVIDLR